MSTNLAFEACKVKNGLSPNIMNDLFQFSKIKPMNLEAVIIFKGQISKLCILATNLLRRIKLPRVALVSFAGSILAKLAS